MWLNMYSKLSNYPVLNFFLTVFFSVSKGFNVQERGIAGLFERFFEPVLIACGYWVIFIEVAHRESSEKAPIFLASIIGWLCLSKVAVQACAYPARKMMPSNSLKYILYLSADIAISELLNIVIPFLLLLVLWTAVFGESGVWFFQYAIALVTYTLTLSMLATLISRLSQWLSIIIRFTARFGLFLTGILFQMPSELSGIVSFFSYLHPFDELLFNNAYSGFYMGLFEDLFIIVVAISILSVFYFKVIGGRSTVNVIGCLDGVKSGFSVNVVCKNNGYNKRENLGVYCVLGRKLNPRFNWSNNNILGGRLYSEFKKNEGCENTKLAYMKSCLDNFEKGNVRLLIDEPEDLWKSGLISRGALGSHDSDLFYLVESKINVSKD